MKVISISPYAFWDEEEHKGMPSIYLGQKAFVDAGHEVLYVFPSKNTKRYEYEGIQLYEFKFPFPVFSSKHIHLHRLSLKAYCYIFVIYATIIMLKFSRKFDPDVIYGHFFQAAPVAWAVGKIRHIPNITRMYGTFLFPWLFPAWKRLLKIEDLLAFKIPCNYFIMTNDGTRGDDCAEILGMPKKRLIFLRNGVNKNIHDPSFDKDKFKADLSIPRKHKLIVAVSRLVRWKRVDRLVTAMPAILKECPETTAIIVGDGDQREMLESFCRKQNIQDRVRFVGAVYHEEVYRFFNGADIFVSLYELSNVGNPILEALCCAKCIVSINNGATGKLIRNGKTGILLEENGLHELPEVLIGLLKDDSRRLKFERAALEYAQKNLKSWPERLKMEVDLIEHLVCTKNKKMDRWHVV
jgi:glycosyltransferase involved in cell wall biosynthesis